MGTAIRNHHDARVKRTRQRLIESLIALAATQDLSRISVEQITAHAGVNRATFYAHFADKRALVEVAMRASIQQVLQEQFSNVGLLTERELRRLIGAVAELLRGSLNQCRGPKRELYPLIEASVQQELHLLLARWVEQSLRQQGGQAALSTALCSMLSWTIFGATLEWSRRSNGESVEAVAERTLPLLLHGLGAALPTRTDNS